MGGEPYLKAEPNCGELSRQDENNQIVPGTIIHLTGKNFRPDTEAEIWWSDPLTNEFQVRQAGEYVAVMTDDQGSFELDLIMPYSLIPPSAAEIQTRRARPVLSLIGSNSYRTRSEPGAVQISSEASVAQNQGR